MDNLMTALCPFRKPTSAWTATASVRPVTTGDGGRKLRKTHVAEVDG